MIDTLFLVHVVPGRGMQGEDKEYYYTGLSHIPMAVNKEILIWCYRNPGGEVHKRQRFPGKYRN
jgi:hypothetical protein